MSNLTLKQIIRRGGVKLVNGQPKQKRVGAVVAIVKDKTLNIGWSLCNRKEGDRFNTEIAENLASGRAIGQHENSISLKISNPISKEEMMRRGVPQSCIRPIQDLISTALHTNNDIKYIVIFNTKKVSKTKKEETLMWHNGKSIRS